MKHDDEPPFDLGSPLAGVPTQELVEEIHRRYPAALVLVYHGVVDGHEAWQGWAKRELTCIGMARRWLRESEREELEDYDT